MIEKRAVVTRTVRGGAATVTATATTADQPAVQQVTVGAGGIPSSNGIQIPVISNTAPVVTVTSPVVVTMSSGSSINTSSTQIVSVGPAGAQNSISAQSAGLNGLGSNASMNSANGGSSGLSGGAIAGIVIGAIAAAALLLGLILLALARRKQNERRALASDMMGPSALPDPYASSVLTREVPGSFVRFDNYSHDDVGSMAGLGAGTAMGAGGMAAEGANSRRRPVSGYESDGGYRDNAYDDISNEEDDYANPRRDVY